MAELAITVSERKRLGISLPLLFGLLVYSRTILGGGAMVHDADPYWHIATGRWILAHGTVPKQDIFSFSMPGAPWTSPEWLARGPAAYFRAADPRGMGRGAD
jgi:hypothetical protein